MRINANDLKVKGVAAIESALEDSDEAVISVRGKERFVVVNLEHYQFLRECELDKAIADSKAEIAAGDFFKESVESHLNRLKEQPCTT
jgi:uncharacterized protein YacL (UPF0231 family)